MTNGEMLSSAGALISATCAIWVAIRDARWRNSDVFKDLQARIARAEQWCQSPEAKALAARVDKTESRLDVLETSLNSLATKQDLEGVKGEVHALSGLLAAVQAGVNRIETFLLERDR